MRSALGMNLLGWLGGAAVQGSVMPQVRRSAKVVGLANDDVGGAMGLGSGSLIVLHVWLLSGDFQLLFASLECGFEMLEVDLCRFAMDKVDRRVLLVGCRRNVCSHRDEFFFL